MTELEPVTAQSHPYRPELALLRVRLLALGYHQAATEAIVAYTAHHGTLEGAPCLESEDHEKATETFVEGMEEPKEVDEAWYEGAWTADEAPTYFDVENLLRAGGLLHEEERLFDAEGRIRDGTIAAIRERARALTDPGPRINVRDCTDFTGPDIPRRELCYHVTTH